MGLTIKDFKNYYKKYKELSTIHKEIFGLGNNPIIPSLYSENLCRFIYNMEKSDTKESDAIIGNKIVEIKATTSKKGITTINPYRKFDVLFWLFIDVENDRMTVKKLPFKNFKEAFANVDLENDPRKKIRLNITLQNYVNEGDEIQYFDLNSLKEIN